MGGVDLDVIGERENLVLQCLLHGPRHLERVVVTAEEVRTSHVANEEGATGQQEGGRLTAGAIGHEQADVLGGVTRCVKRFYEHLPHLDPLPIPQRTRRIPDLCPGSGQ